MKCSSFFHECVLLVFLHTVDFGGKLESERGTLVEYSFHDR